MRSTPIKRKSGPPRRGSTRTCAICGESFQSNRPRKTCAPRCLAELKRRSKLGDRNPSFKHGDLARWRQGRQDCCAVCGGTTRLTQHHVVYEQHVVARGGDPFDPRNSLTVCFGCHMGHHHGIDRRIKRSLLTPDHLAFATELFDAWAPDYFARYYADEGELDKLLGRAHVRAI